MANRWGTGRTEAFSDGVFAIAITLLVLDISVPEADFDDLWNGIVDQWPAYLGYATSFLTIGAVWLAHHGIGFYLGVTLLAILAPYVAAVGYLVIAILFVVRAPSDPGVRPADAGGTPASSG